MTVKSKVSGLRGFARLQAFDPARHARLSSQGGQETQRVGTPSRWSPQELRTWGKVAAKIRWKGHKAQKR